MRLFGVGEKHAHPALLLNVFVVERRLVALALLAVAVGRTVADAALVRSRRVALWAVFNLR